MKAHIATCVAIGGRGVLIEGASGTGKSALALAMIDRGAMLVGDDGVLLAAIDSRLIAYPHPHTRGLLEIRNLGLLTFPTIEMVEIALVIKLDPAAPRFIEGAGQVERAGLAIPALALWPDPASPVLKVEQALRIYGLHT
jgi:serine kinase of HPr protein (carbohydrate metabolism regulator)